MQHDKPLIRHVMPDDDPDSGDTSWFFRQNTFERDEIAFLVKYKRSILQINGDGRYPKNPIHSYPHILPDGFLTSVFYSEIADDILRYLEQEDIQQHTELLNLKSSQAACLNFLFPLRMDHDLATCVLRKHFPFLDAVTDIEFEFTGQDETPGALQECTKWLGEPPGGKRGQNRTSIDAAIFWTDKSSGKHITLVEWKYTERSFGSCSAFDKAKGAARAGCQSSTFKDSCLLVNSGPRRSRHYFEHLDESGIRLDKMGEIPGCPFRGPFYQLMRQFLVAQFLRKKHPNVAVDVLVIHFSKNEALAKVPKELRPLCRSEKTDVIEAWNSALENVPKLRSLSIEEIMAEFDSTPRTDSGWRDFIRKRYRV